MKNRGEVAVSRTLQNGERLLLEIGEGEVWYPIAIEIGRGDRLLDVRRTFRAGIGNGSAGE